jgi:hypothetical protein
MVMNNVVVSLDEEMLGVLEKEKERKQRYLEAIPETIRAILSEYLSKIAKIDKV